MLKAMDDLVRKYPWNHPSMNNSEDMHPNFTFTHNV